jgi:glycosyltransferase involved in cell wall biosynthesis
LAEEIMTTRIGIDGRVLGPRPKGIARYIWELSKALDKVLPEARFFVYSPRPIIPMPSISARWSWRCDLSGACAQMPNSLWAASRLGYIAQRDNLDVFWGGTGLLPFAGLRARKVLTVHDLVYKIAPETTSARARWTMRMLFGGSVRRADRITSNSFGTARRFESIYPSKVTQVVQPGLTDTIRPKSAPEVRAQLRQHSIDRPYLLSVGTLEPRKGLQRLIPAFLSLLRDGRLNDECLVIAGDRGWKDEPIARLVRSSERIRPLGFVDDEALSALYTGAKAFIFPSSYEGFGIPVLEARACGTRVVTTDIPELREAGNGDAIYVAPTVEGIRDGILAVLRSDWPAPLNRAEHSWLKSAATFARVLTEESEINLAQSA